MQALGALAKKRAFSSSVLGEGYGRHLPLHFVEITLKMPFLRHPMMTLAFFARLLPEPQRNLHGSRERRVRCIPSYRAEPSLYPQEILSYAGPLLLGGGEPRALPASPARFPGRSGGAWCGNSGTGRCWRRRSPPRRLG